MKWIRRSFLNKYKEETECLCCSRELNIRRWIEHLYVYFGGGKYNIIAFNNVFNKRKPIRWSIYRRKRFGKILASFDRQKIRFTIRLLRTTGCRWTSAQNDFVCSAKTILSFFRCFKTLIGIWCRFSDNFTNFEFPARFILSTATFEL